MNVTSFLRLHPGSFEPCKRAHINPFGPFLILFKIEVHVTTIAKKKNSQENLFQHEEERRRTTEEDEQLQGLHSYLLGIQMIKSNHCDIIR